MTIQEGAAIVDVIDSPPARTRRSIPGSGRFGDVVLRVIAGLVLLYIFLPIFVIVLFSFNKPAGKFNYTWQGFTLDNWADPFKYPALAQALKMSVEVAALSTLIAVVLGTLLAIALVRQRFRGNKAVDTFLVLPLTAPEVVMGASLLTLFLDLGWATGFTTILIAHVAFEISFVAMTVRARVRGFDWTLEDASMDLGASPSRTFFRVTLPLIVPGIVAAAMLSFALSHVLRQRFDGDLSPVRQRRRQGGRAAADRRARDGHPGDQPGAAGRRNPVPPQARRHLARRRREHDGGVLAAHAQ